MQFPQWMKNESLWILVFTLAYIVSGVTESETVWQVVVVVATYIGGTTLKTFAGDFLAVLKKIDVILDRAGIHWEDVLEDALQKIKTQPEMSAAKKPYYAPEIEGLRKDD